MTAAYDAYVICTSPRSGSTLLCTLLAATGNAGQPDSHFHEPSIATWLGYYGLTPDPGLPERDCLALIFEAAIATGRGDTDVFGLRLQRHSFDFFREKLGVLHADCSRDSDRFEAAFGRTLFIHLTRQDKIAQAVSYVTAEQSGLWHRASDGTELERLAPPRTPVYDAAEIQAQLDKLTAYDAAWNAWFTSEGLKPLRITYEALADDPRGTLRHVLNRLGLDCAAAATIEPGTAKLADRTSQAWVDQFRSERAGRAR